MKGKNIDMDKMTQDMSAMGREGMEAFIQSGTIFAKGCENMVRASMEMAQNCSERQSRLIREAMTSKSLNEWTEVQNKLAQATFDDFMTGTTRLSEMGVKMLSEAAEPINNQFTKAMNKAGRAA